MKWIGNLRLTATTIIIGPGIVVWVDTYLSWKAGESCAALSRLASVRKFIRTGIR